MPAFDAEILDPRDITDWDDQVLNSPSCSVFHTAAWLRVLADTYRYAPLYLVHRDAARLTWAVPLVEVRSALTGTRGVSLPFTDFCPPWRHAREAPEPQGLREQCLQLGRARRWRYIEFRGNVFGNDPPPASAAYLEHTIDLTPGEGQLFRSFRGSVRRAVRKGNRVGLETSFGCSQNQLAAFCRLNRLTRREHGLPPQPRRFFRHLHRHVLSCGMGQVVVARHEGRPVAAAVFLHAGRNALFKYGASDSSRQDLRANTHVMWEAIRWYAGRGYAKLSLGRTNERNEGLRRFKMSLHPDERRYRYFRYSYRAKAFLQNIATVGHDGSAVLRRLPLGAAQLLGDLAYRHVG